MASGERIGEVTHFFGKINVAVISLSKDLDLGETVHFLGRNTDFKQEVASMQIEHEAVERGEAGEEVALKVKQRVRKGDAVFLLEDEA